MKFTLAFVLIDLDPWYKTAASEMIRSARRAYKDHDMTVVQLTDNRSAHCPDADGVFVLKTDVKGAQFCQAKGHLMAEFALQAAEPVIFCDVDLIWNNDHILEHIKPGLASVMDRCEISPMPFNTGIVISGGGDKFFWNDYSKICADLPLEVCGWYGDQFAMLAAVYADESRQRVRRMDMDKVAPPIDTLPDAPLNTPAVHFKGEDKRLMIPYARMVDGGAQFEFARPAGGLITGATGNWKPDDAVQYAADAQKLYVKDGFTF